MLIQLDPQGFWIQNCVCWMRKVMIVVRVLMTNCQMSRLSNNGLVQAYTAITDTAMMNVAGSNFY